MTTYTLTGIAVYRDPANDTVVGVDNTNVTMEVVVPAASGPLRYSVNPLEPGENPGEGDETVDITSPAAYEIRIDGQKTATSPPNEPVYSIFEVDWSDGSGNHTSTVLVPFLADTSVPGLGLVDADYIFVIDGDMIPPITTPAAWNAFEGSITSIEVPTGTYGPDTNIPLNSLGASVSQKDVITGSGANEVYKTGGGADDVHGKGGNDTLRGEAGNDKLFGDNGNDKVFGGTGNDTQSGGAGNDTLKGDKGRDTLKGDAGKDVLDGGGGNDKMTGGTGFDTFIFSKGADRITDFNAANNKEKIDLSDVAAIKGFTDLKNNHLSEVGNDVVIEAGNDTLTLKGLSISDLDKGDFIF